MINIVIAILLAISTHTACDIGKPTDYYAWVDAHPDYSVPMQLSTPNDGDYWLMSADGEYYLFAFAESLDKTIPSGASHGACFRKVS
jgi:glycosidase